MKYLLFSSAVVAALFILATEEGRSPDKISASLKSVSKKVRSEVAAIVDHPADSSKRAPVKAPEDLSQVPEKDAHESYVSTLPIPVSVPLRPVIAPVMKDVSDDVEQKGEGTLAAPPPPPAPTIPVDTKRIKSVFAKPVFPSKTKKIRLAEGDSLMTPKQRRRELNALARDMESMFLDKVVK